MTTLLTMSTIITTNSLLLRIMKNKKFVIFTVAITGIIWLLLGFSCEKAELIRSVDSNDFTGLMRDSIIIEESMKMDDKSGISFKMESDSLEEDIEDVYFNAKEWEEDEMNVDL